MNGAKIVLPVLTLFPSDGLKWTQLYEACSQMKCSPAPETLELSHTSRYGSAFCYEDKIYRFGGDYQHVES